MLTYITYYEIYLGYYAFEQNDESLVAHQKEFCGPPVEKHCLIQRFKGWLEVFDNIWRHTYFHGTLVCAVVGNHCSKISSLNYLALVSFRHDILA